MSKFGFNTAEVEVTARQSYDPIPKGEYTLKAVEAEEKETAKKNGSYIKVKFEVVKGEYVGRLIWHNFNVNNASEKAQTIGRQELVAWAMAAGKPKADDTDQLLEKPFSAAVGIEKQEGYEPQNVIKAFLFEQSAAASSDDKPAKPAAKAADKPKPAAKSEVGAKANPWD